MTAACPACGAALTVQTIEVRNVGIVIAPAHDEAEGLLAWASVVARDIAIDGLAVRRRTDGDIVVTFPARRDRRGALHRTVTPVDAKLDGAIRAAVIAAYVAERGKLGRRAGS